MCHVLNLVGGRQLVVSSIALDGQLRSSTQHFKSGIAKEASGLGLREQPEQQWQWQWQ